MREARTPPVSNKLAVAVRFSDRANILSLLTLIGADGVHRVAHF